MKGFSKIWLIVTVLIAVSLGLGGYFAARQDKWNSGAHNYPANFDECAAAGNLVTGSYPRQCAVGGQKYAENEHQTLLESFSRSHYVVTNGKVVSQSKWLIATSSEEKEIEIISGALDAIKGKISVPEGTKVIIQSDENAHVIIFENKLPEGALGGDYSAKVTIDAKSGKALEVLGSD